MSDRGRGSELMGDAQNFVGVNVNLRISASCINIL